MLQLKFRSPKHRKIKSFHKNQHSIPKKTEQCKSKRPFENKPKCFKDP